MLAMRPLSVKSKWMHCPRHDTFYLLYVYFGFNICVYLLNNYICYTGFRCFEDVWESGEGKKGFTLMPCWNILKGEDKWALKRTELAELEKLARQKKNKNTKASRPREEEGTSNYEAMVAADRQTQAHEARKRPNGVKKEKEALRRGGGEACMQALDKMWVKKEAFDMEKEKAKEERFLALLELEKATLELEKKRVANDEKRAEAELMKEEKEIMLVDKRSLDPMQMQWCEMMQKKIMARLLEN